MRKCVTSGLAILWAASFALAEVGKNQGVLDPNLATEMELLAVPHLSAALVKSLVGRCPFMNELELSAFSKEVARLESYVTLE